MSTSNTPRPLPPPGATDMQDPDLYRFYLFACTVQACLRTPTWANIQAISKGTRCYRYTTSMSLSVYVAICLRVRHACLHRHAAHVSRLTAKAQKHVKASGGGEPGFTKEIA